MAIKLHNLVKGSNKSPKRVGRGNSSKHGTYSTRGQKGQKSRSGVSGLKLKGMKHIILSTPKLKGFRSIYAGRVAAVTLGTLDKFFKDGETVSRDSLLSKKIIKSSQKLVKIISRGELSKKLTVEGCKLSKSAKEIIEKLGGKVVK